MSTEMQTPELAPSWLAKHEGAIDYLDITVSFRVIGQSGLPEDRVEWRTGLLDFKAGVDFKEALVAFLRGNPRAKLQVEIISTKLHDERFRALKAPDFEDNLVDWLNEWGTYFLWKSEQRIVGGVVAAASPALVGKFGNSPILQVWVGGNFLRTLTGLTVSLLRAGNSKVWIDLLSDISTLQFKGELRVKSINRLMDFTARWLQESLQKRASKLPNQTFPSLPLKKGYRKKSLSLLRPEILLSGKQEAVSGKQEAVNQDQEDLGASKVEDSPSSDGPSKLLGLIGAMVFAAKAPGLGPYERSLGDSRLRVGANPLSKK